MNDGYAPSVYWRYSRGVMRRHPVITSAMVLTLIMFAVKFGPTIFWPVVVVVMAAVARSGRTGGKIPTRDFALYVAIAVLVFIAAVGWTAITSRSGR